MGRRFKLKELAAARGVSEEWYIDHIVVPKCNSRGQQATALELGVSQATISEWLRDKYVNHPFWMKKMSEKDRKSIDRVVAQHQEWEKEQNDPYKTIKLEGEKA